MGLKSLDSFCSPKYFLNFVATDETCLTVVSLRARGRLQVKPNANQRDVVRRRLRYANVVALLLYHKEFCIKTVKQFNFFSSSASVYSKLKQTFHNYFMNV